MAIVELTRKDRGPHRRVGREYLVTSVTHNAIYIKGRGRVEFRDPHTDVLVQECVRFRGGAAQPEAGKETPLVKSCKSNFAIMKITEDSYESCV